MELLIHAPPMFAFIMTSDNLVLMQHYTDSLPSKHVSRNLISE